MNLDDAKDVTICPAIVQVGITFAIVWYLDSSKITDFFAPYSYRDKLHELTLVSSLISQCIYQFVLRSYYRKRVMFSLNAAILMGGFGPLFPVAGLSVLLWHVWPEICDRNLGTIPLVCYIVFFLMTMYTVHALTRPSQEHQEQNTSGSN
jgi:hypothetical protein